MGALDSYLPRGLSWSLVRKLLVTLAGEVHARIDAIAAIWVGCVGRPNLGALIDASADGIGSAGGKVCDASGNTTPTARLLWPLKALIVTFEGGGLVHRALGQTKARGVGRPNPQRGQHRRADDRHSYTWGLA